MNRQEAISNLASAMDLINGIDHVLWESIEALVTDASPDPITGLMPCGCGGKAILFHDVHQPDIEWPGIGGDRWAVFCEKTCGMETSDLTSREYAVETWNTGMGYTAPPRPGAIGPETGEMAPNGDKGEGIMSNWLAGIIGGKAVIPTRK